MTALVGRDSELCVLKQCLADTNDGKGSTVLISGEPGIGKTRLVSDVMSMAEGLGFQILTGRCEQEKVRPFLPFSKALGRSLFIEEEHNSFAQVLVFDEAGSLAAKASPEGKEGLGEQALAGMLVAVQSFVRDSFSNQEGSLGRLEYGDMTVIAERSGGVSVAAVFRGAEHPDMRRGLLAAAEAMGARRGISKEAFDGTARSCAESLVRERFLVRRNFEGMKLTDERTRISDIVLAELSRMARDIPTLLILEDVHWADESSMFVLEYLAGNLEGTRAVVVATMRPQECPASEKLAERLRKAANILDLAPFDASSVRRIIDSAFPGNDFSRELAKRLAGECRGNPFFIKELLRQMASDGAISKKGNGYRLEEHRTAVPATIEEMARRRLASLDQDAMAMAEYASCIGREFDADAARSLPSLNNTDSSLEKLSSHGIVVLNDGGAEFAHAIFQEAIYANIAPRWKSAYHKSLGEHFERAFIGRLDDAAYELARHFSMTNEHAKAYAYLARAGEKAEGAYALEQSIDFYLRAVSLAGKAGSAASGDRILELRERTGDMLVTVGRLDEAIACYETAFSETRDLAKRSDIRRRIGGAFHQKGDYERCMKECESALRSLGDAECIERARLMEELGFILSQTGQYERAESLMKAALPIAEKFNDRREVATLYHGLGGLRLYVGDFESAMSLFGKATSLRESLGDLVGLGKTLNNIAIIQMNTGRTQDALETYRRSLDLKNKTGDRRGAGLTLSNMATLYEYMGELDKSRQNFEKALEIRKKIGDTSGCAIVMNNLATIHHNRGDSAKALELHAESLRIGTEIGKRDLIARNYCAMAEVYSDMGELKKARDCADKALAISIEMKSKPLEAPSRWALAIVHRLNGDYPAAEEELDKALALFETVKDRQGSVRLLFERGKLAKARGDKEGARALFEKARAEYKEIGLLQWVGMVEKEMRRL